MTTVQFRIHENGPGRICCCSFNASGQPIAPRYPCDQCKAHFAALRSADAMKPPTDYKVADYKAAEESVMHEQKVNDYSPPNPYRSVKLTAAEATTGSAFEDTWKRSRREALDAERHQRDVTAPPPLKTLTAEELAPYSAPSGWDIALRARRLTEKS